MSAQCMWTHDSNDVSYGRETSVGCNNLTFSGEQSDMVNEIFMFCPFCGRPIASADVKRKKDVRD